MIVVDMADERDGVEALVLQAYTRSQSSFDLVISAFLQALHSHRRPSVCTPFPTSLFATEQGEKDFAAAEEALREFSKLHVVLRRIGVGTEIPHTSAERANPFSKLPLKSLKLVQWLLRLRYEVHLVGDPALELPKEILVQLFGSRNTSVSLSGVTPDFILKLDESGERASTTFEQHKLQYGSVFAFHGTSAENLHSILRCGLLIMSNSSLQRNGAIFGEGIYLSTDPAVALGFSKAGMGWDCSQFGQRARYLLLCEIAMGGQVLCSNTSRLASLQSNDKDLGTYIVVQNCDLVKLRFIFVYVERSNMKVIREDAKEELEGFHPKSWLCQMRRVDWCKAMILFYVVLLIIIALINSHSASKLPSKLHKASRR